VWEIRLPPGSRYHFHRHALDYLWTAVTPGVSIQHTGEGETLRVEYEEGDTVYSAYGNSSYKVHDLENTGSTELVFVTVELMESANAPLALEPRDG
jgi:oxalate decarboxylase/phosphoglucose isomerase-like protein (cupin superfamily)